MITDPRVSACIVLYKSSATVLETVKSIVNSDELIQLHVVENSDKPFFQRMKDQFKSQHLSSAREQYKMRAQMGLKEQSKRTLYLSTIMRRIENIDPKALFYAENYNAGYGKAHNDVLPDLKSVYHLIINPDITFDHTLISRMVDYMDAHPDIVLLSPRVFFPDGTEQHLPHRRPTVRYLLGGMMDGVSRRFYAWRDGKIAQNQAIIEGAPAEPEEEASEEADSEVESRPVSRGNHFFRKHHVRFLQRLDLPFDRWREEYTMKNENITEPIDVEFATGCFMMIRTHAFYQMKGFDPRYFLYQEDSDLTLKALKYGRVVYHPDMQVTHAWNRADARSMKLRLVHIRSTLQFFWKWGWKW